MKTFRQLTAGVIGGAAMLLGATARTADFAGDPAISADGRTWSAPDLSSDGTHWGFSGQGDGTQWE